MCFFLLEPLLGPGGVFWVMVVVVVVQNASAFEGNPYIRVKVEEGLKQEEKISR